VNFYKVEPEANYRPRNSTKVVSGQWKIQHSGKYYYGKSVRPHPRLSLAVCAQ